MELTQAYGFSLRKTGRKNPYCLPATTVQRASRLYHLPNLISVSKTKSAHRQTFFCTFRRDIKPEESNIFTAFHTRHLLEQIRIWRGTAGSVVRRSDVSSLDYSLQETRTSSQRSPSQTTKWILCRLSTISGPFYRNTTTPAHHHRQPRHTMMKMQQQIQFKDMHYYKLLLCKASTNATEKKCTHMKYIFYLHSMFLETLYCTAQ